ncbi:unnamed protein product [Microthlaspi erraticum]|uniref:Uncharacterized protein n=1 Tax=Microthlaspi erraticum TaxID=1685480 RepID=A0A6D2JB82_9BRAS|nr:unnamed protein product [Microthlaspi erraticum]
MVALVRWEPVMEPTYPSAIKFWVRMMGILLHFWAEPTFQSIGEAIGEVLEVDIDGGRVKVCLDGYKPLTFETTVAFHSGEEMVLTLREYATVRRVREERESLKRRDEKPDGGVMSYKGVVINGPHGDSSGVRQPYAHHVGDPKGKGKEVETREDRGKRNVAFRGNGKHGDESSGVQRKPAGYLPPEQRKRINRPMAIPGHPAHQVETHPGGDAITERTGGNRISPSQHSAKKVRKAIDFTEAVAELDEIRDGVNNGEREMVGENEVAVITATEPVADPMILEQMAQEEREEGETWWNEVIEEAEVEKTMEEFEELLEIQEAKEMALDEVEKVENSLGVERFMDVEAKETGKQKHVAERKVGARREVTKPPVGVGGSLKRMLQGAKTPKKKPVSKEGTRIGDMATGSGPEKDPSEGSETTHHAV